MEIFEALSIQAAVKAFPREHGTFSLFPVWKLFGLPGS